MQVSTSENVVLLPGEYVRGDAGSVIYRPNGRSLHESQVLKLTNVETEEPSRPPLKVQNKPSTVAKLLARLIS